MSDIWNSDGPRQSLRKWWFGGDLHFREHPLRWLAWLLDEGLDRIPTYEERRWFRHGGWGCRLRLHRFWDGNPMPEEGQ